MPTAIAEKELQATAGSQATPRKCAVLIFVFFSFFYLITSSGRVRTMDEYMAFFETESLALRHSATVPQAVQLNYYYGKYDTRGEPRTPYPPGHPLFATPWYLFGRYVLERLPGLPANSKQMILEAAVCFSSACFAGVAVAFMFLIGCGVGLSLRDGVLLAGIVGLATPVFAYSSWFFSEPLTTALMLGAAYFVFGRHAAEAVPIGSALIGGVLLGAAVFVRPAHALVAAVFFVALLARDRAKAGVSALLLAAVSTLGLVALLLYNFHAYGSPFEFGYPAVAEGGKRLNSFETPLLTGLVGFLFSPGKSIFLFAPPVVVAMLGMRRLWKLDRGLATVAGLSLPAYLLFYSRYSQWEGGYCVGPRYMVPALALLCLGLIPVIANKTHGERIALMAVSIMGVAVQAVSMATSFMESQVPAGVYYGPNWNYRMGYSLWNQVQVLIHHTVNPAPARLGLGFDRWFVFLGKAGVSHATLAALFCVMAVGAIVSGEALRRTLQQEELRTTSLPGA
jgi:hypothetical protein